MEPDDLIPLHGGCRKLKSFQVAPDGKAEVKIGKRKSESGNEEAVRFCDRSLRTATNSPRSRTHDQMVQAARSGVPQLRRSGIFVEPNPKPISDREHSVGDRFFAINGRKHSKTDRQLMEACRIFATHHAALERKNKPRP